MMIFDLIEKLMDWTGILAGLATLAIALFQGVWRGLQHPAGGTTGKVANFLRRPLLLVYGLLWIGVLFILWHPFLLTLSTPARLAALVSGLLLYFSGQALYLWGAYTLGEMYRPASAFGVQLNLGHRLITHGPFAYVRHPLYLGLQIAALGGLLLYRNWTFVFIFVNFLGLFFRARREEQALTAEFGKQWRAYCQKVPAWIPRLRH